MSNEELITGHYTSGKLLAAIETAVIATGKTTATITVDELSLADEFHIGGRAASKNFLDQLSINSDDRVLDVGCGLGGTSRFVASHYGSRVNGIDLTKEFIETGKAICRWVGLQDLVRLDLGSATAMPYPEAMFSKAYMMHVGMNIGDKKMLALDLYRVLKPGGTLGIYDVIKIGDEPLSFPVPWASTAAGSFVESLAQYRKVLEHAGFKISVEQNRRDFALTYFDKLSATNTADGGVPPLGLHIVMGKDRPKKIKNMIDNIVEGRVAPFEIIAKKQ